MHSIIRAFPSFHFYENKLEDHQSVKDREDIEKYPEFEAFDVLQQHFSRIVFFDLTYSEESQEDSSKNNVDEAKFTFHLIRSFIYLCGNEETGLDNLKGKIGLVTPYKGQVRKLRSELDKQKQKLGCSAKDIVINTVDGF